MTLEEAKSLSPGDIISCAGNKNRIITQSSVHGSQLEWKQKHSGSSHSWEYKDIQLVSRKTHFINNTYEIY